MIGRRCSCPLGQFLELASENVFHLKLARKLLSDITKVSSSSVQIHLLEG
jgi:hypothetical protein